MQLTLTDDEARMLRDVLIDHFQALRLEVSRTEVKDFRHSLMLRQDLVERLIERLGREVPAATP